MILNVTQQQIYQPFLMQITKTIRQKEEVVQKDQSQKA